LLPRREFKRAEDMFAQDSIHLLEVSGIDFAQMEARGIEVHRFGEVLITSGIVLNDEVSPLCMPYRKPCMRAETRAEPVVVALLHRPLTAPPRTAARAWQRAPPWCTACPHVVAALGCAA
jgi:hypothetical protein